MKKFFFGGVVLVCMLVFLQQGLAAKPVPSVMYQFLARVVDLSPFIYDQEAFVTDKNSKKIAQDLQAMQELSAELTHHTRLTTPGYEKSAGVFIENINRVHDAFEHGHKAYAYRLVRSTLHACSSCHTQEKSMKLMHWDFSSMNLPKKVLDQANLYYTVRGFEQAWTRYKEVVSSYGKKHSNNHDLDQALDRLLIIALRVDRDPKKVRTFLEGLGPLKLPAYFQNQNAQWITELQNLEKEQGYQFLDKTGPAFESYINDLYRSVYPFARPGRSQKVVMEYATGMMFEFINNRPQDITQGMLYWLGVSNLELDEFEAALLGEQFLQDCIEKYRPTLISHQCFTALEDQWVIGFSGSSGIYLPFDLEKKLKDYRQKLNIDQPWRNQL